MPRDNLLHLLGNFEQHRFSIANRFRLSAAGYRVEHLDLMRHDGTAVRGILAGPSGDWYGLPAILYCHAHGNRYAIGANELIEGRPALLSPYAPALAHGGILALSIDMPCFGRRQGETESAEIKNNDIIFLIL